MLEGSIADLVWSVREQMLEGLIAKRRDSRDSIYEPGQRSGEWRKMRVNQGQEFVIGGYTRSPKGLPLSARLLVAELTCKRYPHSRLARPRTGSLTYQHNNRSLCLRPAFSVSTTN